uniref:FAR1 domain-containing protein n=1 Tax=Triticum urartu TaxID=4572 RepID=A0A8R7QPV1_TRIUA
MNDVDVNMQSKSYTLEETNTIVAGPTETELRAGAVGVGVDRNPMDEDEAGSRPMEPFVRMRFDTLQGAKDHYNDYALRMGFSIKMNTSRRNSYTNILEKQQFACNKFRKPKEDDTEAELPPVLDPILVPKPLCEEEEK